MEAFSRREVRLVLETNLEQLLRLPHPLGLGVERMVEVFILRKVKEAAGHVQQLTDGDVLSVANLGLVFAYRVVESEPAFVNQLQNDRAGKRLGVAAYAKVVVGRNRSIALQGAGSEGLAPSSFTRNIDVNERPRNPEVAHLLFDLWL